MTPETVHEFFRRLEEGNPAPTTELEFANPFELLVAVILSAQATDRSVNAATPGLFAAAPDPGAMAALGEAGVRERIRTIGLFNSKARNLVRACELLLERQKSQVSSAAP